MNVNYRVIVYMMVVTTMFTAKATSPSKYKSVDDLNGANYVYGLLLNSQHKEDYTIAAQLMYYSDEVNTNLLDLATCQLIDIDKINLHDEPVSWLFLVLEKHGDRSHLAKLENALGNPMTRMGRTKSSMLEGKVRSHKRDALEALKSRADNSPSSVARIIDCNHLKVEPNTFAASMSRMTQSMPKREELIEKALSFKSSQLGDVIKVLGRPFYVGTEADFFRLWFPSSKTFRLGKSLYLYYQGLGVIELERLVSQEGSYRTNRLFIEEKMSDDWLKNQKGLETFMLRHIRAYHAVNYIEKIASEDALPIKLIETGIERLLDPVMVHMDEHSFQKLMLKTVRSKKLDQFTDVLKNWKGPDKSVRSRHKTMKKLKYLLQELDESVEQYSPITNLLRYSLR